MIPVLQKRAFLSDTFPSDSTPPTDDRLAPTLMRPSVDLAIF
jgi:hypothetical protein